MSIDQNSAVPNRNALILSLQPVVVTIAKWLFRKLPYAAGADQCEELIQAGYLGAIRAVDEFDPARGASLETYAGHCIRSAILDFMRRCDPLTKLHRRQVRRGVVQAPTFVHSTVRPIKDESSLHSINSICNSADVSNILDKAELSNRNRDILLRCYSDQTMKEIGERYGVHESRISQIHKRSLELARKAIESGPS
jgi:RNA polymerase sigma factor (sigma-70 family)